MCRKNINTILITGASSGLGRELSIQYAKPNNTLYLTGRNIQRLNETADICLQKGANVIFKSIDVTDKYTLKEWILECDKKQNIDLIIANAGISAGTFGGTNTDEEIYNIYNTNIFGVINTINPIIENMIKRKNGHIALISSMSGFIGMASCPAYSSSKACITALGEGLRGALKQYNVKVTTVCPGFIKTPLTDKNSFAMPLIMSTEKAAKKIIKGISKNKGMVAFPLVMYLTLKILRILPFSIVNYIFSKLPKK